MSRVSPKTERARDGFQVPRMPPNRLNTGTLESWWVRPLGPSEQQLVLDVRALGANLVGVQGGYAIQPMEGRDVLAVCPTAKSVRAWMAGRILAKAARERVPASLAQEGEP